MKKRPLHSAAMQGQESPAAGNRDGGQCGANLNWTLDDEGTLTISGTGAMYDGLGFFSLLYYDVLDIRAVVVEEGVTSIGEDAFYECLNLERVTIPDSVTSIGFGAFFVCPNLKCVTIPSSVTTIGHRAFEDCTSLESVTIPSSVTAIGYDAFDGTPWFDDLCVFAAVSCPG